MIQMTNALVILQIIVRIFNNVNFFKHLIFITLPQI